ncbi:hypothetical protein D3C86_1661200 [compost metagenome]
MRPMWSTSSLMVCRLLLAVALSPRARKRTVLPDRVRRAASGWLSSWAMLVDICPITASLPAWTSSSWVWRRCASVCRRSRISALSRSLLAERSAVRSAMRRSSSSLARCSASRAARRVAITLRRWFSARPKKISSAQAPAASRALPMVARRWSCSGVSRVRRQGVSSSGRLCSK